MESLFVYGTLKRPSIQKKVFGRCTSGTPEILRGYVRSKIRINNNTYPVIMRMIGRYIRGLVLAVNSEELKLIDQYETSAYRREMVFLDSGKFAWAYVK